MDLYVDDAFGSAHRAHASTEAVAHLLPAYAGLLLLAELEHLGRLLGDVERPFVLVAGGAKVEDKLGVLQNLGGRADTVIVGGKMAEELRDGEPAAVPRRAADRRRRGRCVRRGRGEPRRAVRRGPDGWLGLDIGPDTRERFGELIRGAKTVFWNGPMGVFEWARFAEGTKAVAEAVAAVAGVHRRRRGRLRARDLGARARGRRLVGLDRRRRIARAARGARSFPGVAASRPSR